MSNAPVDPIMAAIVAHGRYTPYRQLGKGSYGSVYDGIENSTKQNVALKVIDLEEIEDDIDSVMQEIAALANCNCPQITKFHDAQMLANTSKLLISMELMACSGVDLLELSVWPEECIAYAMRQVLEALAYLHSQHRMHRDVKAANILLHSTGEVKIADFGVSGQLTSTLGYKRKTFVGTPYWMAPEVIESTEEGYTTSADIWSLGIMAIELAKRRPPHSDLHPMKVLFVIPKADQPVLDGPYSEKFKDFVRQCTMKDPLERPSATELLAHPFLRKAQSPPAELEKLVAQVQKAQGEKKRGHEAASATLPRQSVPGTMKIIAPSHAPLWDFPQEETSSQAGSAGQSSGSVRHIADESRQGGLNAFPVSAMNTMRFSVTNTASPSATQRRSRPTNEEEFTTRTAMEMAAEPTPRRSDVKGGFGSYARQNLAIGRVLLSWAAMTGQKPADSLWAAAQGKAATPTPRDLSSLLQHGLQVPVVRDILRPSLQSATRASRGNPAVDQAVSDSMYAFAQLETAQRGACADFVAELLNTVVNAPVTASGECQGLQDLARQLARAVHMAPEVQVKAQVPMREFLLQRWRAAMARQEIEVSPFLTQA